MGYFIDFLSTCGVLFALLLFRSTIEIPVRESDMKEDDKMLPQDPVMLLSYINTQLRDNYSSPELLFDGLDVPEDARAEIIKKLRDIGYTYNRELNQFK